MIAKTRRAGSKTVAFINNLKVLCAASALEECRGKFRVRNFNTSPMTGTCRLCGSLLNASAVIEHVSNPRLVETVGRDCAAKLNLFNKTGQVCAINTKEAAEYKRGIWRYIQERLPFYGAQSQSYLSVTRWLKSRTDLPTIVQHALDWINNVGYPPSPEHAEAVVSYIMAHRQVAVVEVLTTEERKLLSRYGAHLGLPTYATLNQLDFIKDQLKAAQRDGRVNRRLLLEEANNKGAPREAKKSTQKKQDKKRRMYVAAIRENGVDLSHVDLKGWRDGGTWRLSFEAQGVNVTFSLPYGGVGLAHYVQSRPDQVVLRSCQVTKDHRDLALALSDEEIKAWAIRAGRARLQLLKHHRKMLNDKVTQALASGHVRALAFSKIPNTKGDLQWSACTAAKTKFLLYEEDDYRSWEGQILVWVGKRLHPKGRVFLVHRLRLVEREDAGLSMVYTMRRRRGRYKKPFQVERIFVP